MAVPMAIRMAVPMAIQRVEVITGREVRRRYSDEERRRLVEAAFGPGVKTAEFARHAGVDPSLLYRWRRQLLGASAPTFTPVAVVPDGVPPARAPGTATGVVEVELPGGARVRMTGPVDPALAAASLAALVGRSP